MPPARPAPTAPDRSATPPRAPRAPRPRRVPLRDAVVRLRWERLGRIALLVVLLAVIGLYAEHTLSYLSTHAQNARQQSAERALTREHSALEAEKRSLGQASTIVQRARALGMIRPGEQPFDITGAGR